MKLIHDLTIGADIEVFLQHRKTQEIISAEGFIQGTKEVPYNFDPANPYYAVSLDNVLAEFCIPPARSKEEFYASISKSLAYINNVIPKPYCTAILQSYSLDDKWLQTKHSQVFGCDPDYNAYSGYINVKPSCDDKNLRSAGGHIHVGYADPMPYNAEQPELYVVDKERAAIIQALDLFIGVPSVILEPDNMRKQLYGKAGCCRPKPYGVEYRTVSNFYLQTKELTYWAYEAAANAIDWLNAGNVVDADLGAHVQHIINNNDKQSAQDVMDYYHLKAA